MAAAFSLRWRVTLFDGNERMVEMEREGDGYRVAILGEPSGPIVLHGRYSSPEAALATVLRGHVLLYRELRPAEQPSRAELIVSLRDLVADPALRWHRRDGYDAAEDCPATRTRALLKRSGNGG